MSVWFTALFLALAVALQAQPSAPPAAPLAELMLEDFERRDALAAWELDIGAEVKDGAARLRFASRRSWRPWRDPWPNLRLSRGGGLFHDGDWRDYDHLEFAVENRSALAVLLKLRIDDAAGTRAIRHFALSPQGRQVCRVDLELMHREIDLAQVSLVDLYLSHPARDVELALDDLRLVAAAPDLAGAELLADPFGGGRVRVRADRGRPVLYRVEIRDDQGTVVREYVEETARLDWTWTGGAPGRYRALVSATDPVWGARAGPEDLGEFAIVPAPMRPGLVAWGEPTTRKIATDGMPRLGQALYTEKVIASESGAPLRLEMARNEVEGLQVVFRAERSARVRLAVAPPVHSVDGVSAVDGVELYQVGYVFTRPPAEYPVDTVGWWPDPLLRRTRLRVRPGENQVAWLALRTAVDTRPGLYRGQVEVWVDEARLGAIPLEIQVHDAALPDSTTVRTAFSLYDHMLTQVYGAERAEALRPAYEDFVVDHRLNPDNLYRRELPDLERLADYARQGRLNAFNLLYLDARAEYDRAGLAVLAERLDPAVARLAELGLLDRAYIYGFDEVESDGFDQMERAFAFIKDRYPRLRTATTARDPGLGLDRRLGTLVDIWVPLTPAYELATATRARQRGAEVWWYICVSPIHPYANWFIEYPAIEARLLWWMAHRRGVEGFLYYAINRWPGQRAPLQADAYGRTRWNPASYETANGDGSLFYPGVDGPIGSIRLENVRDGIEDYELLALLAAQKGDGAARALSDRLVRSLTEYSRDPEEFARVRRALLRALAP